MLSRGKKMIRMAIEKAVAEDRVASHDKSISQPSVSADEVAEKKIFLSLPVTVTLFTESDKIEDADSIEIKTYYGEDFNDILLNKNHFTDLDDIEKSFTLNNTSLLSELSTRHLLETSNQQGQDFDDILCDEIESTSFEKPEGLLSESERSSIKSTEVEHKEGQKRKGDPMSWKKNRNKALRMTGEDYIGYRRTKEGRVFYDNPHQKRITGPTCSSKKCVTSAIRQCNLISEEMRRNLFHNNYWKRMHLDQRKVYLANMVECCPVQSKIVDQNSKRKNTLKYHFMIEGRRLQVCQAMFLQTFGIKQWTIRYWIGNNNSRSGDLEQTSDDIKSLVKEQTSLGMAPKGSVRRSSRKLASKRPMANEFVYIFFNSLAKLPSHYCRLSTTRLYLEPVIHTLQELYDIYKNKCKEHDEIKWQDLCVSIRVFKKVFDELNLARYKPKKDKCDTCCCHEVGNITDEEFVQHRSAKDNARLEKESDKALADKTGKIHVFTSDLKAVKLAPSINSASAQYYKTKLNVHNFTMYNLDTKEVICYWFDESAANLEASTFASCVLDTLNKLLYEDPKPIIIWSDGCGYQNRNAIISNALLHLNMTRNIIVEQTFLVKGHSQMGCDSVRSMIERTLNNKEIFLPSQNVTATKESRKHPFPYEAKCLQYSFFKKYCDPKTMIYPSIRPGKKVGDPTVTDIRAIKYIPVGEIQVKLYDFKSAYNPLPRPRKINHFSPISEFPQLYSSPRRISERKWKDLQDLKKVIPQDCHPFYDGLIHI